MKKYIFIIFIILGFILTGCVGFQNDVELTGDVIIKEYSDKFNDDIIGLDISKIFLKNSQVKVEAIKSTNRYIKISAQESFFDDLIVKEYNNLLKVQASANKRYNTNEIKIEIGATDLQTLILVNTKATIDGMIFTNKAIFDLSGKSLINISNLDIKEVEIDSSGASEINLDTMNVSESLEMEFSGASLLTINNLTAKDVEIDLSGASKIELANVLINDEFELNASGESIVDVKGSAKSLDCNFSGSSKLNGLDFIIDIGDFECSGKSIIEITVNEKLSFGLSGSSILKYKGHPKFEKFETSGKSKIEQLD